MTVAIKNFKGYQQSYAIAASTTSANQVVSQPAKSTESAGYGAGGYTDLHIYNATAGIAFISYGMSAATATTSSPDFVAPGAEVVIAMGIPATNIAVILSSGSGYIYAAVGEGS